MKYKISLLIVIFVGLLILYIINSISYDSTTSTLSFSLFPDVNKINIYFSSYNLTIYGSFIVLLITFIITAKFIFPSKYATKRGKR